MSLPSCFWFWLHWDHQDLVFAGKFQALAYNTFQPASKQPCTEIERRKELQHHADATSIKKKKHIVLAVQMVDNIKLEYYHINFLVVGKADGIKHVYSEIYKAGAKK